MSCYIQGWADLYHCAPWRCAASCNLIPHTYGRGKRLIHQPIKTGSPRGRWTLASPFFLTLPQNYPVSHSITLQHKALQKVNSSSAVNKPVNKHDLPYSYCAFLLVFGIEHSLSLFSLLQCTNRKLISPASAPHFIKKKKKRVWKFHRSPGGKWHNPRCCRIYVPAAANLHVAAAFPQPSTRAAGGALLFNGSSPGKELEWGKAAGVTYKVSHCHALLFFF